MSRATTGFAGAFTALALTLMSVGILATAPPSCIEVVNLPTFA